MILSILYFTSPCITAVSVAQNGRHSKFIKNRVGKGRISHIDNVKPRVTIVPVHKFIDK